MGRRRKPLPIFEAVGITDYAAEGKALARVDDFVVFVPFAVPGDIVDLRVRKKRHSYCEAEIVRFARRSDLRVEPRCRHFGTCGGCKWQSIPYDEQLRMKASQVEQQLRRIGKVELPGIMPILGSEKVWEYRNKLEFGCSPRRWLTREELASAASSADGGSIGFHATGAFDKILPIGRCHLMDGLQDRIRHEVEGYARANDLTFHDARAHHGLLRGVMVRNSDAGEWMVLVQFHFGMEGDEERAMGLMGHLGETFPEVTSLLWVDNQKLNDTFSDLDVNVFKGKDHIIETMGDLRFKVGPKSFYQTNTAQAHRLYSVVRDFAGLTGKELVYDLYTGTGTIANFVASGASRVVGIECVPEAIGAARVNSGMNGIGNTEFLVGDMKDVLVDGFFLAHGKPDVIITDPPRAGMHRDVVQAILGAGARRVVYVSCNPATQARDISLMDARYAVAAVQPVDMFPHTPHVENVVLLERRPEGRTANACPGPQGKTQDTP